jgi:hypothetical protein
MLEPYGVRDSTGGAAEIPALVIAMLSNTQLIAVLLLLLPLG